MPLGSSTSCEGCSPGGYEKIEQDSLSQEGTQGKTSVSYTGAEASPSAVLLPPTAEKVILMAPVLIYLYKR